MKLFTVEIFSLGLFLILLTAVMTFNTGCSNPLTPASPLVGTWKTAAAPATMYYAIGGSFACGFPAVVEGIGTRVITWTITSTGDNSVNINSSVSESDSNVANSCNFPWTADSQNDSYTGTISSSNLTVTGGDSAGGQVNCSFNFTTSILTGTWKDQFQVASNTYEYVYSPSNQVVLTKQ